MLLNILIPLIGVVADQLVKYWASTALREAGTIPLWEGVFHLTYCENTGAAFSLLSGHRWVLLAVTAAALTGMLVALSKNYMKNAFGRTSLRLIIAGAVGNMLDRFLLGYVVDMFDFRLIDFPVFNVADSAICIGAAILIIDVLFFKGKTFIDSLDKKKNTDGSEEKE